MGDTIVFCVMWMGYVWVVWRVSWGRRDDYPLYPILCVIVLHYWFLFVGVLYFYSMGNSFSSGPVVVFEVCLEGDRAVFSTFFCVGCVFPPSGLIGDFVCYSCVCMITEV